MWGVQGWSFLSALKYGCLGGCRETVCVCVCTGVDCEMESPNDKQNVLSSHHIGTVPHLQHTDGSMHTHHDLVGGARDADQLFSTVLGTISRL